MRKSGTQATNRFGAICTHARAESAFVAKDGRIDTVILTADHFDAQDAWFEKHGLWCDDLRVW